MHHAWRQDWRNFSVLIILSYQYRWFSRNLDYYFATTFLVRIFFISFTRYFKCWKIAFQKSFFSFRNITGRNVKTQFRNTFVSLLIKRQVIHELLKSSFHTLGSMQGQIIVMLVLFNVSGLPLMIIFWHQDI